VQFLTTFEVPEVARPIIGRIVAPEEIALIEALTSAVFSDNDAKAALEASTGDTWPDDAVQLLLRGAYARSVLALEDETGMVNVTLWPDAWARLRGVVRRHALLYVDGVLQREANVVNVVAREVRPLPEVAESVGGPTEPEGVRALGYSGMRRC